MRVRGARRLWGVRGWNEGARGGLRECRASLLLSGGSGPPAQPPQGRRSRTLIAAQIDLPVARPDPPPRVSRERPGSPRPKKHDKRVSGSCRITLPKTPTSKNPLKRPEEERTLAGGPGVGRG